MPKLRLLLCLASHATVQLTQQAAWASDNAAAAEELARQGLQASLHHDHVRARALYRAAFALDPAVEYQYSLARTSQQAGDCADAVRVYDALLVRPDLAESFRIKAAFHRQDAAQAVRTGTCKPDLPVPAVPIRSAVTWAFAAAGGAALLTGGGLLWSSESDAAALDRQRDNQTGLFRADRISPVAARAWQSSIAQRRISGATAASVGVVGLVTALVLWWTTPTAATPLLEH